MIEDKQVNSESAAKIPIADEDAGIRNSLSDILVMEGYRVEQASNGEELSGLIKSGGFDLLLLDVNMPEGLGFKVISDLKEDPGLRHIPVVVITSTEDFSIKIRALKLGADDFLIKPPHLAELLARVRSLLKVKSYNEHMINYQALLEKQVAERTARLQKAMDELAEASIDTIFRLSRAAEYKDDDTALHIKRMSRFTAALSQKTGFSEDFVRMISYSTPLHDIGKIGVPDDILLKPGKLNESEWKKMKEHPEIGASILDGAASAHLQQGRVIALTHHEKWDGSGYPCGLSGDNIPVEGRLVAVADVFDALTSRRPYKEPVPPDEAFRILIEEKGRHFDPGLVDHFLEIRDQVEEIMTEYGD